MSRAWELPPPLRHRVGAGEEGQAWPGFRGVGIQIQNSHLPAGSFLPFS